MLNALMVWQLRRRDGVFIEHPSDTCILKPGARKRPNAPSVKQASQSTRNITSLMATAALEALANSYMHAKVADRMVTQGLNAPVTKK